ncbi:electron transport complex subunit RsxB [Beggiatoa leptomitoformis]|uniref:Ion-translocating oxidoreductase complex subunit B n=1 Tax=Beggiatoa leptomitoformis TaxID=288004 RepID=A0A2N9YCH5_9GAMM|nr:electron transport complex subunit RsxB [Beggiatoa leptomitoformis]ALG66538.1 electron transport complex subunit RsxB [Beggiatoa leptomitoformis]AUI68165.1 electron transport complex subunit RsxB [Beggiatoa leptomitoformis]
MSVLLAILLMAGLTLVFGLILGLAAVKFKVEGNPIVDKINDVLPQLQCGKCGYPGCHPYAEAVATENADINLCPPGGENGMLALAHLLDREPKPLSEEHSAEKPKAIVVINEQICIGCTLCIQACPVDAILGSAKHMHTIIASECTGCELCIAPCPVDCISLLPILPTTQTWKTPYPVFHLNRLNTPRQMETSL